NRRCIVNDRQKQDDDSNHEGYFCFHSFASTGGATAAAVWGWGWGWGLVVARAGRLAAPNERRGSAFPATRPSINVFSSTAANTRCIASKCRRVRVICGAF